MAVSKQVLIVGTGNMGSSLARGLTPGGDFRVRVFDVHGDRARQLAKEAPVEVARDVFTGAVGSSAVVLCVKPQDLAAVALELKAKVEPDCLIISILAGVTIADVEEALDFRGGIVRAMPNIAATAGAAATGMACNDRCSDVQKELALAIFGRIGEADWIKESLLDAVTGLSGSGPAYIYMVIEALTDGGVKMGIPRAVAAKLATQTVFGAAKLVKETGLHPAILREQVTTPGGTTINAIHELEDRGLRAMLISAVETATNRAAYLRKK
jgi:pyrroline-5-carboxylate reductase